MTKTIESLLLNVMELASAALADGAPPETKRQAGVALRGVAAMIDGGAPPEIPAATAAAQAGASTRSPAPPAPKAEPARPDFMSVLMGKLAPMLPEGALSQAAEAARAEGFRMPMGIDLENFVQAQARVRS